MFIILTLGEVNILVLCKNIMYCYVCVGGGGYFRILQNPSFFLVYNVNEKRVTYQFWTDALTAWSNRAAIKIN